MLVEATGSRPFQHPWAPIHPMQLEEAPSLQLRWGVLSHSSHLPSPGWVPAPGEGSGLHSKWSPSTCLGPVSLRGEAGFWGWGVGGNLSEWGVEERAGDVGRPHLSSHQAGATGHIQD